MTLNSGESKIFFVAVIWPIGVTSQQAKLPVWTKATAYSLGDLIVDSNGNLERVTVAGTSASETPTWASGAGLLTVEVSGLTWQNMGPGPSTTHLKVTGNTFHKMQFGVWVDNNSHYDQVKHLEFVNNTCLNMQDLAASGVAAGLWADGAAAQHIENLVVTGNRFINEADNAGYKYGIEIRLYIDNLYLGADNVFYNIKSLPVFEQSVIFNRRGPVIEAASEWAPGNVSAGSFVSTAVVVA